MTAFPDSMRVARDPVRVGTVAALYDIHGNLPALDAVLAELRTLDVHCIVVGGDVSLGPMPREVLERLRSVETPVLFLRGNCDRLMMDAFDDRLVAPLPDDVRANFHWSARQLEVSHRDFLESLPTTVEVASSRILEGTFPGRASFVQRHLVSPPTEDEMLAVFEPRPARGEVDTPA